MGKHGCSVFKCEPSKKDGRHRFPNPKKWPELFVVWMHAIKNIHLTKLTEDEIYNNYRVCSKHFGAEDFSTNASLKKNAVPHLFLPKDTQTSLTSLAVPSNTINFDASTSQARLSSVLELDSENKKPMPSVIPTTLSENLISSSPGLLRSVGVKSVSELSPKAKSLYKQAYFLKKKINRANKKVISFKERLRQAEKFSKEQSFAFLARNLSSLQFNFFKRQLECAEKKAKGRRFTVEDKVLAVALYKKSPAAYRLLSAMFALPSRVTIQKFIARIPIKPGINEAIFNTLHGMGKKMSAKNKLCVLLFDEMSLLPHLEYNQHVDYVYGLEDDGIDRTKKIANHAQVYMLRGAACNWKQPIAYTFVHGGTKAPSIKKMIKTIFRLTKQAGFKIIATVCDQGSNNVSAINEIVRQTQNKHRTKEYVMEIDGDFIVPIFDPPHLLKSVRNNLLTKDLHFEQNGHKYFASWNHIALAYTIDSFSGFLRAMPKLTEQHINPKKIKKMKVSYCAQVFSHTVAATMNLLINNGSVEGKQLNEDAKGTTAVVKFFDDLFDSVNGTSSNAWNGKFLRTAIQTTKSNKSEQEKFWESALPVLKSMHILKDNGQHKVLPCFKNWQRTLEGFKKLKATLNHNGVSLLKCRYFNQDPLENFFGKIRQRGQRFNNPTCSAFEQYYKSLLLNGLVSKHSLGSNCENDDASVLLTLQHFMTQGLSEDLDLNSAGQTLHTDTLVNVPDNYTVLKPLEKTALGYVAGYIIKVRGHIDVSCLACRHNVLLREDEDDDGFNILIKEKEFGGQNVKRLKYCNFEFVQTLLKIYNITRFFLDRTSHTKNLFKKVQLLLNDRVQFNFIECEHSKEVQKKVLESFVKLIIFNYFKGVTNVLSGRDQRPLPQNVASLYKNAKDLFLKRKSLKVNKMLY